MDYIALKINKTITKVVEYFKHNKNDPYEGIKILEKFILSEYILFSGSTNDYFNGKRSIKRKFMVLIFQLCIWILSLKSLFISYHNNRTFSVMTGDFTYLYPKPDILNIMLFSVLTALAIIGKNNLLFRRKNQYD